MRRESSGTILITEAPISVDEEFANRRRRYLLMMGGRAVSVVAAVVVYGFSPLLAGAFLVMAAVLPWAAVLLANNRPAKQTVRFRRFLPGAADGPPQLTAGPDAGRSSHGDPNQGERTIDL